MSTLKMALRNVGRNRRRTAITTAATTLAVAMMIVYTALFDGVMNQMERSILVMDTGHVQIHKAGYREDPSLYATIDDPDPILAKLDAAGVHGTSRLFGFALAAAGTSSAGVQLRGFDLEREVHVTEIHTRVDRGQWLDASDPNGVVIGKRLAKSLGVDVGDDLIVLGQATDGSMANARYKVRGVLKPVNDAIDRASVLMGQATFRELMVMPTGAHEIAVIGTIGGDLDAITATVRQAGGPWEVKNWRELNPVMAELLDNSRGAMTFMILLTYSAVIMVVFNAMLMSVFERVREFGILKAIGLSPFSVATMILIEALFQAILASIAAVAIGLPLAFWLERDGLDFSAFAGDIDFAGMTMEPIWYGTVTPNVVVQPLVWLFVLTVLAVAYPAGKAALIRPVEAFRQI